MGPSQARPGPRAAGHERTLGACLRNTYNSLANFESNPLSVINRLSGTSN